MLSESAANVKPKTGELKIIAKGAGINFIGHLSIIVLNVAFQFLLARTLGPAKVGVISLALSVTYIASALATFGLQSGALRFVALYAGQGDRVHTAGAIIAGGRIVTALSLVTAAILFAVADLLAVHVYNTPALGPVVRLLALSLPLSVIMGFLLSVTQGLKRMEYRAAIGQIVVPLLKIGGLLAIVYTVGCSIIGVACAIVVASMVGAILAAVSVWRLYPLRDQRERPILVTRGMLAFSWPLMLMSVVNLAWRESEVLVLGALTASDQVGIYYVGTRATVLLTVFLNAFSAIFAPIMVELHGRHERKRLDSLLKTVTRWGFSLCLPIFLLLFAFSGEVLLAFGPGFATGARVLQILAVSQLFNVVAGPVGWLLAMSDHPRLNLLNSLLMLGLSFSLDFLLIPRYGIIGAAAGGALSIFLVNMLRLIEVYAILRIHPYSLNYLKPIAAGLLSVIAMTGLRFFMPDLPPIGQVILFAPVLALTYIIALMALRLDEDDWVVVDACRRRLGHLVPYGAAGR